MHVKHQFSIDSCAVRTDLTLQQLRVIAEVSEAGSFTAAARHLVVAQSSLSRTVAEVERRLGTALFERTTRRLEPTAAGRGRPVLLRRAARAPVRRSGAAVVERARGGGVHRV